jgi:hypothetical protein
MKPLLPALVLLAVPFAVSGCNDSHAADRASEPVPACSYKEGAGLELSPAGNRFLGLQTAAYTGRLPEAALLRTAKGDFVYVANGRRFLRTPVGLGAADQAGVAIREGLYEGDIVVVAGVRGLWLAELQAVNGGVGCADGH